MTRSRSGGCAEICRGDRLERFDLAAPPLMRFALMRLCGASGIGC